MSSGQSLSGFRRFEATYHVGLQGFSVHHHETSGQITKGRVATSAITALRKA
jgi:hypothetical protein